MWRRLLRYAEVPSYNSLNDLGPADDDGRNAYDYVVLYRLLTPDEKISTKRSEDALVVVKIVRNDGFAPDVFKLKPGDERSL